MAKSKSKVEERKSNIYKEELLSNSKLTLESKSP